MDEAADPAFAEAQPLWLSLLIGVKDPPLFSSKENNEGEAVHWVRRVPDGVHGVSIVLDTFTMVDPPKEVCEVVDFCKSSTCTCLSCRHTKICTSVVG